MSHFLDKIKNNFSRVFLFLILFFIPAITHAALTDGLIGYYSLDGKYVNWQTGTITNQGSGGGTLTLNSLPTTTTPIAGVNGQAFYFASTTQLAQSSATGTPVLTATNNFAMSVWMKPQAPIPMFMIAVQNGVDNGVCGVGPCNGYGIGINNGSGGNGSKIVGLYSGVAWIDSGYTISSNQATWYHVVLERDNGTTKLYVNGVLQFSSAVTAAPNAPSGSFNISGQSAANTRFFKGVIDEVRLYNRALSDSEVAQLYKLGGQRVGVSATVKSGGSGSGLTSSLVGYWTMDGKDINWSSNTITDRSGTGKTGTPVNMSTTTSPSSGIIGQSLIFDGANSYVSLSNLTNINFSAATDARTVSAWIKTTQAINCIFCVRNSGIPSAVFDFVTGYDGLTTNAGRLMLLVRDDGNIGITDVVSSTRVDDGKWHFVSATVTSGKVMQLYIDGVASGNSATHSMTGTLTGAITETSIGKEIYNPSITPFKGQIDDVRVYNRALLASEIAQLYKQGGSKLGVSPSLATSTSPSATGLSNGLVGYWTLDGKDTNWGTNSITDRSGRGNTATTTNMSTTTSPTPGKIGQALYFDGLNDSVNIPDSSSFSLTATDRFSIFLWMNEASTTGINYYTPLLNKMGSPTTYRGFYLQRGGTSSGGILNQSFQFGIISDISTNNYFCRGGSGSGAGNILDGKWHYVGITYDGSGAYQGVNVYVDGQLDNASSCSATLSGVTSNTTPIVIGREFTGPYFKGSIDDIRIYNRVLSSAEVAQLYKLGGAKTK